MYAHSDIVGLTYQLRLLFQTMMQVWQCL